MRPRIRTIKPELWQDEKVGALSRDARVLMLGLVTMADDEGRFRARRSQIIGHVFPVDEDAPERVDEWTREIQEQGIVVFYIVDGTPYGAFRHWRRHQSINRATSSDLPPPPDPKVVRDNRVRKTGARSERNGSAHGSFSESDVSAHFPARRRAFRSDPIPVVDVPDQEAKTAELCYRLAFRIRANDPKAEPGWQAAKWATDMRLLIQERGGDDAAFTEVEQIIDWCQADPFWRSNVLSPGKLRKQFTQLVLKAKPRNVVSIDGRRDMSHLPENLRPTPEWQAQINEHIATQHQDVPEWLEGAQERMQAELAKERRAG